MGRRILDPKIVEKLSKASSLEPDAVRVKVSKLASKKRVPSEVALVLLAHKEGIGTSVYQRSLDQGMQTAIRDALAKSKISFSSLQFAKDYYDPGKARHVSARRPKAHD